MSMLLGSGPEARAASTTLPLITTFSIVAYDPESNEYGIAVQSKFFSVGSVVPFAEAEPTHVLPVGLSARGLLDVDRADVR